MKTHDAAYSTTTESPLAALCQTRPWLRDLILATLFGALTALSAQASIRVPWSPVPLTGQVFAVLLAGGLLGARWGAVSQLQYLALGFAGLPVFAGGSCGPLVLAGPTGGYLIGFVAAAWAVGALTHRGRSFGAIFAASLCGVCIIHLLGWSWLAVWLGAVQHTASPAAAAFAAGVAPFLLMDVLKAAAAARIAHGFRRKAHS